MQDAGAAAISNPIRATPLAVLAVGRKGAGRCLEVKSGGRIEPGKPGRAANESAGKGVVGVDTTTNNFRG